MRERGFSLAKKMQKPRGRFASPFASLRQFCPQSPASRDALPRSQCGQNWRGAVPAPPPSTAVPPGFLLNKFKIKSGAETLLSSLVDKLGGGADATAAGEGLPSTGFLGVQPLTTERPAGRGQDAPRRAKPATWRGYFSTPFGGLDMTPFHELPRTNTLHRVRSKQLEATACMKASDNFVRRTDNSGNLTDKKLAYFVGC
jgi:hypothetical protein